MFFITKILPSKTVVVIPDKWVFDIEEQWERLVNSGINPREKFVGFYSEEQFDDEGRPNELYIPDWENVLSKKQQFPECGCYYLNILHSEGK